MHILNMLAQAGVPRESATTNFTNVHLFAGVFVCMSKKLDFRSSAEVATLTSKRQILFFPMADLVCFWKGQNLYVKVNNISSFPFSPLWNYSLLFMFIYGKTEPSAPKQLELTFDNATHTHLKNCYVMCINIITSYTHKPVLCV